MIDITGVEDGPLGDMIIQETQTQRAANILSIQIGSLEYAPDFGIDLKYFLDNSIRFQTSSFKAYLVERLASYGINATEVVTQIDSLSQNYIINVSPEENSTGMVAR